MHLRNDQGIFLMAPFSATSNGHKVSKTDKIIFLDVDGVLNDYALLGRCHASQVPGGGDEIRDGQYIFPLFNKNVDPFISVAKQSNAKIVLSSTWRHHRQGVEFLQKHIFDKHNLQFIGRTPNANEYQLGHQRFNEILQWFKLEFNNNITASEISQMSWVAIDDDPFSHMSDFIEDNPHLLLENRLIKCDSNIGFTEKHAQLTLKRLGVV